ncbi:MAG: hypothetical protein Q9220_006902 [cf. Caloplaca sp. 1 TL-2023]
MPRRKGRRKGQPKQQKTRARDVRLPLPQCEGPKLHPFSQLDPKLEYIRLLSNPEIADQSYVFEVTLDGKAFALKIFKYYDDEYDNQGLWGSERDYSPLDHLDYYFDPFYNECRAYGKLVAGGLNGESAVRCHGYMMLPAEHEEELERLFGIERPTWGRDEEEHDLPVTERSPLKAIVKDLVLEETSWTKQTAKRIKKDLKKIRELEVYPMDIKADNYAGGLLVDFSVALTEPHFIFDIKALHVVRGLKVTDLADFDFMIEELEIKTSIRAYTNEDTLRKLRSYKNYLLDEPENPRTEEKRRLKLMGLL